MLYQVNVTATIYAEGIYEVDAVDGVDAKETIEDYILKRGFTTDDPQGKWSISDGPIVSLDILSVTNKTTRKDE